jgi:hypothetical protein
MPLPVKTGFPEELPISDGYQIIFAAVDPTTGADVSGVTITDASIYASATGDTNQLTVANPILIGINT